MLLVPAVSAAAFQPGEAAPNFTLKDLAGRDVSLADLRGQLVVLDLGTTWCPGCRYQNRELAKIDSMFDDSQVRILEIFMRETVETVRGFLKGLDLPEGNALLDDGSVQKGYNVYLIPRVLIIDGQGRVRFDAGLTGADEIETQIRALLAESKEVKEP
ncbi:TlpA family protein disulfide reductase [Geothermobacter hydrogeniphilus]|uniref:TlpA family protein disulfide reductase n=1 Tax=Geothermobacter hydrogeniphilus TaxID=1969733 RepID=UPI0013047E81|nr:TlpA disulfide reductase family protein [Geothermobacter hydrogeniphilus]